MTSIGFIGLGSMGQAMAARLLEEGFEVGVWNRTASAGDELVAAGAARLDSPAQAFERDIVVSILANDQAVDAVFSEELLAGAAAAKGAAALHVNMASISLETARAIEARHAAAGVRYLGAPVMGRPNVARTGQLNILAGGPAETVEAAAPALDALGKKTWHVAGDAAGASLVKIGVNYNLIHALGALGESINLVERGGVDPQLFVDILSSGFFSGVVYPTYGKIIAERSYFPAAFNAQLGLKDLTLAEKAAAELGAALPVAPALHELFDAAVGDEERREGDWSIIAEVLRER
jgi:3-hydroxyisobutyrate dehydrogenase-like beta-hydroxyacid dehydrogenase